MFQLRRERPLLHGGCGDHAHHVNHIKNIKYESKWNQLSLIHFINVNLQQINSAITANDNFLPSLRAIREHFSEFLTKTTDGQYSSIEFEQEKLASDSSHCNWTKLFSFKFGAFQNKNTWIMIVSQETVCMEKCRTSKNQISAGNYLHTTVVIRL